MIKSMKCLASLIDDQFPFQGITHKRIIARAFVFNDRHEIAFTHLLFDDRYGHRDYFETPGGGVNVGESLEDAVKREIQEELGLTIQVVQSLGYVKDFYHLIQRENESHYFVTKVMGEGRMAREPKEALMIDRIAWMTIDQAIEAFEKTKDTPIAIIVKRRELTALKELKKIISDGLVFTK
jgi:8-oxo-dGTP diphosphatase